MKYDIEKRNFLLKKFQEKKSYVLVQRSWRTQFINQPAPSTKSTIKEVICQKPNTSIRELARDTKMSPEFVRVVLLNN